MTRFFRLSLLPLSFSFLLAPGLLSAQITGTPQEDNTPAPDRSAAYYHYGLAKSYESEAVTNGRQDMATQAIEQYKLALGADPDSRVLQDGLANLYFRLGRIREAVSSAQDQVKKHPDDIDAHTLLGRVYLRSLGDGQGPQSGDMLQAAIKEYETIAKLKPDDLETHLLLGQLYGLNHDSAKAEAEFKAAQGIDPGSEEVVLSMARLYDEQGDFAKAAKIIADVPAEDRSARMDFALAGLYDQLKQPKDAAAAYRAALDLDPDNAEAKHGLAAALTAAGDVDGAAKVYSQILGANPQDPDALISQADLERQQGHYEQALATLKKASALVSDNLRLSFSEALCYDALGRYDEAIKTLTDILSSTTSQSGKYSEQEAGYRATFLERLAIVYGEAGKTQEQVDTYKEEAALGGEYESRGNDGVVDAYRDGHQYPEALKAAEAAAKAHPESHDLQLTYAAQLADAGKLEEATKLVQAQVTGGTEDRIAYLTLVDMDVNAKHWKDASAALDKAEALSTKLDEKVMIDYYRGRIAERQKLFDQAETEFRKGLALDPNNGAIANYMGYMFADRGIKLDEAVTMLKKTVESDPQNYAYLDSLAWAYFKQGQYAMAEDYERKAVQRNGSDPTLRDHLGEIYSKNNKLQLAITEWQKSLKDYETSLSYEAEPGDVTKIGRAHV